MANPYALAAAAAIALGYGLYKLVTYQTEAEKAQSKLNETIKEADKSLQSELYQINLMFARLKAAKEGTDEYKDAKQAIISQYGEYLKKLGDEKNGSERYCCGLLPDNRGSHQSSQCKGDTAGNAGSRQHRFRKAERRI